MNKAEEPIIRSGLRMLAAIQLASWCPDNYRAGIEAVRSGMLSLYTDAAQKKREEADELIDLSHEADTPWTPSLLDGVPMKDYPTKQLKADVKAEKEEPIVPEWANCANCVQGLLNDGETTCPDCDEGKVSLRAQERLAGHHLQVFPWEPSSDRHVYRVFIPGTEDIPTLTVCWGVGADEDDAIELAYKALGKMHKLDPEEVYATLRTVRAEEAGRWKLLPERPDGLADLSHTDQLLDVFGAQTSVVETVGEGEEPSLFDGEDLVPGDGVDPEAFAEGYPEDGGGPSPENASHLDTEGSNFDFQGPTQGSGLAEGGEPLDEAAIQRHLNPTDGLGDPLPTPVDFLREQLADGGTLTAAKLSKDLCFRFGWKPALAKVLIERLEADGIITREGPKAPWRLAEAAVGGAV